MVFFNFLNFFPIVFEFSITLQVGTKRNGKFYILSFSAFSKLFWLEMMPKWYCWIFLLFFGNFLLRVGWERNRTKRQFLFSLFLCVFQLILSWKEAIIVFSNFLNFFAIFLEFSIMRRIGTERNDNFYFFPFSAFSNLFWLGVKP